LIRSPLIGHVRSCVAAGSRDRSLRHDPFAKLTGDGGDQAFLFGVAVETGHGAQAAGEHRCRPTIRLELTAERFDVAASDLEQLEVPSVAERHELAKVQGVGFAGEAPIAAEEADQRYVLRVDLTGVVNDDGGGRGNGGHGISPGRWDSGDEAPVGALNIRLGLPRQITKGMRLHIAKYTGDPFGISPVVGSLVPPHAPSSLFCACR